MTDNLPAVVPPTTTALERDVARADTDSWIGVVGDVAKFAGYIAGTEFVPRSLRDSPAAATAAIMYGREVGLPPMTALTQTHVIEGRPSLSAEAKRALVLSQGHEIEVLESTGAICRMRCRRRGSERWSTEVVWSIDMARAANLLNKSNWKSHPRRMLQARCSGELCDLHFPDVILGFTTIEDLEDAGAEEQAAIDAGTPQATTKVSRTRKAAAAKKALPAPAPGAAGRPSVPSGPPLPGEDGYDTRDERTEGGARPAEQTSTGTDDGPTPNHGEGTGNDSEAPADVAGSRGAATDAGPVEAGGEATETGPADGEQTARVEKDPPPKPVSRAQLRMIFASLTERGVDAGDDEERKAVVSALVSREVESFNDLTTADANHVIDTLSRVPDRAALYALLDELDQAAGR